MWPQYSDHTCKLAFSYVAIELLWPFCSINFGRHNKSSRSPIGHASIPSCEERWRIDASRFARLVRAAAALSSLLVSDCCVRQPVPSCDPAQQERRQRRWHVPRIAVPVSAAYCALHPCSLPLAPAGSDWVGGFSHPPPLLFEPGSDSNPAARPRARDIGNITTGGESLFGTTAPAFCAQTDADACELIAKSKQLQPYKVTLGVRWENNKNDVSVTAFRWTKLSGPFVETSPALRSQLGPVFD